jgi:hypothetical protein
MHEIKSKPENVERDDLGFILWKLESVEKFYPCYTHLIKQK